MDIKVTYRNADLKNPDAMLDKMATSWQEAYKRTQIALVSIVFDLYHTGDQTKAVARANRAVEVASTGANTRGIVEWFSQMGFSSDDNGFTAAPLKVDLNKRVGRGFIDAKNLLWWSLKPQQAFAGYDLIAAIEKEVERGTKMAAETDEDKVSLIDVDLEFLGQLKALLAGKVVVNEG